MPANKPLYLMRDKAVKKYRFYSHERVAYYSEKDSGATFMIWPKSGENGTTGEFDLFGTFISDNEQYLVQPPKDNDSAHAYTISKFTDNLSGVIDYSMAPDTDARRLQEGLTSEHVMSPASANREKRQTNPYEVEILFVMDYAMYELWYGDTEGQTNRNATTIEHLYQLAAFILSGLNLRYDFETVNGYTITCSYAGIYIADNSAASSAYAGKVASTVLGNFKTWAEQNLDGNYDHAMLYTGIDIGSVTDGTLKLSTAGLAYLPTYNDTNGDLVTPGVCGDNRYSINEGGGFKPTMTTVGAHELGHNFGSYHDNSSKCGENDGYVMAPSSSVSDDPTKNLRLWKFSSCSLASFDVYFNALQAYYDSNGQTNCLLSQAATDATVLDPYMGEISDLPGQIYDPDAQCEKIQGTGSYLVRGNFDSDYSGICALMPCGKPSESATFFYQVAWEGTSCGNGKICQAGQCVTSDLAPNVGDEACLFGDLPYNVPGKSQNCREFLGSDATSYLCYTNSYRQGCCATCEEIKQNNTAYTDCDYGDKDSNCDVLTTSNLYNCANESFRSACCKSCEDKKLDIGGCEYGDRFSNCDNLTDTNLYSCATESFRSGCCKACEEKKLNISDCPYGDKFSNCADSVSSCSTSESTATDCCQTCAPATMTTTSLSTTKTTNSPATTYVLFIIIVFPITVENTDLNDQQVQQKIALVILIYYQRRLGQTRVLRVVIRRLRFGSLIVEFDVEYTNDPESAGDLTKANTDLVSGAENITLLNKTVSAASIQINNTIVTNETVDNSAVVCELFTLSYGSCDNEFYCSVEEGRPICLPEKTQYGLVFLMAVAASVFVFLILILIMICFGIRALRRRKSKHQSDSLFTGTTDTKEQYWPNKRHITPYGVLGGRHDRPMAYFRYAGEVIHDKGTYRSSHKKHREEKDTIFGKSWDSRRHQSSHRTSHSDRDRDNRSGNDRKHSRKQFHNYAYDNRAMDYDRVLAAR